MTPAMLTTLAQSNASNLFDVINDVFSRPDTLAHPQPLVQSLAEMSVLWATLFLVIGLLALINGYRYHKVAVILMAMAIGAFGGYRLGQVIDASYIVAGCLALLLAVLCFPLMRYAVAVMGGLSGAFIGANIWSGLARLGGEATGAADHYWIGALMGLIVCGLLAFIVFKLSVVMFTSVAGATIAVLGGVALVLHLIPGSSQGSVADSLAANALVLPILVFVPALIGLVVQEASPDKPAAKPAK